MADNWADLMGLRTVGQLVATMELVTAGKKDFPLVEQTVETMAAQKVAWKVAPKVEYLVE